MTYRYLYQITNLVNGKIYVGVHITNDLEDGYMGFGNVIKRAIKKHGLSNFKKDILEFFDSEEEMYAREKEVVTEEFLSRNDVYNLRRGGQGGFDFINKNGLTNAKANFKLAEQARLKKYTGESWSKLLREKRNQPIKMITCPECLNKFQWKSNGTQKFCSKHCSVAFNNKRKTL